MKTKQWVVSLGLAFFVVAGSVIDADEAQAETGRFNLHFNPGVAAPPIGMITDLGFDWQFRRHFALDIRVGGGFLYDSGVDDYAWLVDLTAVRNRHIVNPSVSFALLVDPPLDDLDPIEIGTGGILESTDHEDRGLA